MEGFLMERGSWGHVGRSSGVTQSVTIWSSGFDHGDVENRVNRTHAFWQMKGEQVSTFLSDDDEGTKELL